MKLGNPFTRVKDFLSKKFSHVESKIDKEWDELQNIEKQIKNTSAEVWIRFDWWSTGKMVRFWLIWLAIVLLWYFCYSVLNIVFLIFFAYVVSIIVEAAISFFEKKWLNRWVSIAISYLIFLLILIWVLFVLVPFLFGQIWEFITALVKYVSDIQTTITESGLDSFIVHATWIPDVLKEYLLTYISNGDVSSQLQVSLQQNLNSIISFWKTYISQMWWFLVWFVTWFWKFLAEFILFLTLAVLFSVDKDSVVSFFSNIGWKSKAAINKLRIKKMYTKLSIWLKARLFLCLFVSASMWICMVVMWWCGIDIPNKLWMALLIWILDIIPYIWPCLSWVVLFLVWALHNTLRIAFLIVFILWLVNAIENNVLTPLFMNKALWISPVLILISMMIWWVIMWVMWVLLSVPIVVMLVILFEDKEQVKDLWDPDNSIRRRLKNNIVKEKKK